MFLLAQAELVTKGTDYGFVGWVLSVLFATAIAGLAWYAKYVALPGIALAQAATERDQKNKEELTKAVAALCTVVGDNHTVSVDTRQDVQANLSISRSLVVMYSIAIPILRELAEAGKLNVGDDLARMEGVLAGIDTGSKVYRAVSGPQGKN